MEAKNSQVGLEAIALYAEVAGRVLFEDLSFSVGAGEVLQVSGANGSGKTTLLQSLAGLNALQAGTLAWSGLSQESLFFLGHQDGLKEGLSVYENLALEQGLRKTNTRSLVDVLSFVGLLAHKDVFVSELSAGQRRRLALARLKLIDAPLWILDEPFTALDQEGIEMLEGWLQAHIQEGGIVILTTHRPFAIESKSLSFLQLS